MVKRLVLFYGVVGDYDGAYTWVREADLDSPEYSVGEHPSAWPGESYTVVEVGCDRSHPTPPVKQAACSRCGGATLPVEWGCPACGPEP